VQIRSASTTSSLATALTTPAAALATPITRRPHPCYKGRTIDNIDLIEAIDLVGLKLSETLTLVDSIQNQSTEQVQLHHNRSTRPVRTRRLTRFDTDLVVTATPQGCMVRLRPVPTPGFRPSEYQVLTEDRQALPYGLKTLLPSMPIVHLICSWIP
jgi:hypothetical protein